MMPTLRRRKNRSTAQSPPPAPPLPPWLRRIDSDCLLLALWVQPRAVRNAIQGTFGDQLRVRITAPPVDSAANQALIQFFADTLGCPRHQIRLVRGLTSRQKVLAIHGLDTETVRQRLEPHETDGTPLTNAVRSSPGR